MATSRCIFCSILRGEAPASVVHEDGDTMAFMDIRPVNPGHVLVVPRDHASCLAELDLQAGAYLFRVGMRLAAALRASGLSCEGVNLFLADGSAAGQEVFHVHLHVLPRFRGDGFGFHFGPLNFLRPPRASLDEAAARIRSVLA